MCNLANSMQQQMNCDYHVHIGQYCRAYYYADRVFAALKACGTDELWFSSTTSCMYCKESAAARADTTIYNNAPAAAELYQSIRSEVQHALEAAAELGIQAHALYWVVPDIHFLQTADISIERVMTETPYEGFKIHPRAQNWDIQDARTAALAEAVFAYAERYTQRILIHCGDDTCESPLLFEPFIKKHPGVTVQLAHCRPLQETLTMLQQYPNTVCDTAMASTETVTHIIAAGFASRIVYGSDFPIPHWHSVHPEYDPSEAELTDFCVRYFDRLAGKSIMEGGLPFEVKQPRFNAETEAAIEEARGIIAGKIPAKRYGSVRDLFNELDTEINTPDAERRGMF